MIEQFTDQITRKRFHGSARQLHPFEDARERIFQRNEIMFAVPTNMRKQAKLAVEEAINQTQFLKSLVQNTSTLDEVTLTRDRLPLLRA